MKVKYKTAKGLADALGYEGKADAKSVQSFLHEQDIEVKINGSEVSTKTVYVTADAGEDVQFVEPDGEAMEDEAEEKMEEEDDVQKSISTLRAELKIANDQLAVKRRRESGAGERGLGIKVNGTRLDQKRAEYNAKAKVFDHNGRRATYFSSAKTAETWAAAARLMCGLDYSEKANDEAIISKALGTANPSAASILVNPEFSAEIIDNLDRYGAAPKLLPTTPMSNHTLTVGRRTANVAGGWVAENGQATSEDRPTFDGVTLVAGKLFGLVPVSIELLNDAAINVADQIADSFIVFFNTKIDEALINGDGTSTYGGFTGFRNKITSASASYVEASGNLWSEITEGDILKARGTIRSVHQERGGFKLLCSPAFFDQVVEGVRFANGRGMIAETENGRPMRAYGMDVVLSDAMPSTEANSQICALIGRFEDAAKVGQVRDGVRIESSDQRFFDYDQIAWRGINRVAINVHEGDDTSVPGPVVALATAAS